MINKLINQLSTDLVDFFKQYSIDITAQYTPELPGIITYSRNFLARTMSSPPVTVDGSIYQNKLLYRVAGLKPAEFAPHNNPLAVISGFEEIGQLYRMESTGSTISKIRTSADDGLVRVRDLTLMEIPVEFVVITESLELVHAISLLFFQQLVHKNVLELDLDLFDNNILKTIPYFMNWDRDSLEISYANFENMSAQNTVSFNMKLSGAVFSEFYTEDHAINRYDITVGNIQQF